MVCTSCKDVSVHAKQAHLVLLQTFVSRTRLAVQKAEDMTATTFEEDNISVLPSDQGQAPGTRTTTSAVSSWLRCCEASCCLPTILNVLAYAVCRWGSSSVNDKEGKLLAPALHSDSTQICGPEKA